MVPSEITLTMTSDIYFLLIYTFLLALVLHTYDVAKGKANGNLKLFEVF